jgi:hypothetical protein
MRQIMLLVLTLACVVQPLSGQFARGERVGLSQPSAGPSRSGAIAGVKRDLGNTYWKEGGIVAAIPAVVLANLYMNTRDKPLLVGLLGRAVGSAFLGAIFFLPGALIGAQFPKD